MDQREAIERYIAAYNAFDIEEMVSVLHDRVSFQNIAGGTITTQTVGIDAFRSTARESAKLFKTRTQTMTSMEPSDHGVLAKIEFVAVLATDLPNGMKAGDRLELSGETDFSFMDGKITGIVDRS
ncbi:MAG: nuclear transport factor 2 family protein [Pseudomonadota bacterium]